MTKKNSTIAKLPELPEVERVGDGPNPNDAALLSFVKKGGKSARPQVANGPEITEKRLSLRISEDIAARVEQAVKKRPVKTPSILGSLRLF